MFAGTVAMSEEDDQGARAASPLPTLRLGRLSAALRAEFAPSPDEATPPMLAAAGAALAERLDRAGDAGEDATGARWCAPVGDEAADAAARSGAGGALRGRR